MSISRLLLQYLPSSVIPALAGIFLLPLISKSLGPTAFGQYSLIMAVLGLALAIANIWLLNSVMRFHHELRDSRPYSPTLFLLAALVGGLAMLLFLGIYALAAGKKVVLAVILAATGVIFLRHLLQVALQLLRMEDRIRQYTFVYIWRTVAPLLLIAIIFFTGVLKLIDIFIALLICQTLALSYLLVYFRRHIGNWLHGARGGSLLLLRKFAGYGLPLSVGQISAIVMDSADRLIITYLVGLTATGIYSAAYGLSRMGVQFFIQLMSSALGPANVKIWVKNGREEALHYYAHQIKLLTVLVLPAIVVLSVYSKVLLSALTTSAYVAGAKVVPFVALGVLLNGYQWVLQRPLNMLLHVRQVMIIFIFGAIVNLGATWVLVSWFGWVGAAWATLLSYALLMLGMDLLCRRADVALPYVSPRFLFLWVTALSALVYLPRGEWLVPWYLEAPVIYLLGVAFSSVVLYEKDELQAAMDGLMLVLKVRLG